MQLNNNISTVQQNGECLHTAQQACAMLGISRRTLSRLIHEGSLVPFRIRRSIRFTRGQLVAFLESSCRKNIDPRPINSQNVRIRSLATEYSGGSSDSLFERISHYVR